MVNRTGKLGFLMLICVQGAHVATAAEAISPALAAPTAAAVPGLATPVGAVVPGKPANRRSPESAARPNTSPLNRCASATVGEPIVLTLGKSRVLTPAIPVARMLVGGNSAGRSGKPPSADAGLAGAAGGASGASAATAASGESDGVAIVDILLLSPSELFLLGRKAGSMNVFFQNTKGDCVITDVLVTVDPASLQSKIRELMPDEKEIHVRSAENTLVLTGTVSDALRLDHILSIATSFGDGKRVVNLMNVSSPQQVMLEVKIAEVSKSLIDKLGARAAVNRTSNGRENTFSLLSNFLSTGNGLLEALKFGRTSLNLDGQKDDGLVRVLAEPNIMAITGQSASFLSGGKIFIPVSQTNSGGVPVTTLEEKEFGIGVKFTPTVLSGSRINLKMVSEVSDLSQTGSPFSTVNGQTSIIPSFTVRRADTTVQLNDGQSFVIAGLIKNNSTVAIKRFPGLGEVPVLGALFRSTEFQRDETELMFVITPRLVKPLPEIPVLPTANHYPPSRSDLYMYGNVEGQAPRKSNNAVQ